MSVLFLQNSEKLGGLSRERGIVLTLLGQIGAPSRLFRELLRYGDRRTCRGRVKELEPVFLWRRAAIDVP